MHGFLQKCGDFRSNCWILLAPECSWNCFFRASVIQADSKGAGFERRGRVARISLGPLSDLVQETLRKADESIKALGGRPQRQRSAVHLKALT